MSGGVPAGATSTVATAAFAAAPTLSTTPLAPVSLPAPSIRAAMAGEDDDDVMQQTLNIPQLLAFMLLSAIAVRYFFFSSSSSSGAQSSRSTHGAPPRRAVDERQMVQLQAMFPQLARRDLAWELLRNGGSVQAATERVLTGQGLEVVSAY